MPPTSPFHFAARIKFRASLGFTLVELLVVICVIAILAAIAAPMIPSLLKANVVDQSVTTLTGVLEQAREEATSRNTYVWVAFTAAPPASLPGDGIWVATFESQDGTDAVNNFTTPMTIPGADLQLVNKLQNLPGVKITDVGAAANQVTVVGIPAAGTSLQGGSGTTALAWTVTPIKFTEGYNVATSLFTRAVEFTPDGEAHVVTWNSNIQFGLTPSTGSSTNNAVTGKLTVYRP
jgi:prepilin-type N-terminal cleavage/methylation domain-containing protein